MRGDEVIGVLGALAQDHRLSAYRLLVQAGHAGLAAGAIAEALDLPASSLSFHLAQLLQAGLITQRRDGRSLIYAPDYAAMARLIGYLTENCSRGTGCGEAPGYGEGVRLSGAARTGETATP